MRLTFVTLLLLLLFACRQTETISTGEQIELILLGIPENFDTSDISKLGSQKYFKFNGSDSLVVKSCTYLDDRTGEPILPVQCNYYKRVLSQTEKSQADFLIQYVKPIANGELIKTRPEEVYCDLFGGWIVIYTGNDNLKKYFLFDCYGLPDSIQNLCSTLNNYEIDTTIVTLPRDTYINTDSIVQTSCKILEKEFIKRKPKNPVKFTKPE